jgi:cytoskeleton protein RodZ
VTDSTAAEPEHSKKELPEGSIGATLRRARELRNLSEIDLARSLRLEPRIIRSLENERFDDLPAPAFTRGYLRALAKELGLDGGKLLAMFDAKGVREAPQLADFESRAPLEITSDSRIVRYTTLALALAMLVMVTLWWRSHRDSFSMLEYLTKSNPAAVEPIPPTEPLSYQFDQVAHSEDPFFRAPDATATLPDDTSVVASTDASVSPESGTSTAADVVINSSADAWVEVLDAGGARLFYNLVRPGNEVRITGKRPYTLVIGNAPAVRLSFAGKAIDLAPLAREGVVKTILGSVDQPVPEIARE